MTPAVWAVPRSLATTSGMVSFPCGTKMFQFPQLPAAVLWIRAAAPVDGLHLGGGLPHSEIIGWLRLQTAPRCLSQSTTSFFGLWRQGIHHTPFHAYSRDMFLFSSLLRSPRF